MNIVPTLSLIDHELALYIVSIRSVFFDNFFFLLTWLGSWPAITLSFILISALFYLGKKKTLIFPLFLSVLGSGIMTLAVKYLVDRARPGNGISMYAEQLSSFPSAHSSLIFALFGFLIYYVWRFNLSLIIKISLTVLFTAIIALVGFSRLYLGVHFLSDVLAGYLTGLLWVLIVIFYLSRHQNSDLPLSNGR